jgi:hypothetical protein
MESTSVKTTLGSNLRIKKLMAKNQNGSNTVRVKNRKRNCINFGMLKLRGTFICEAINSIRFS